MSTTQDYTAVFKDMLAAFPMNTSAFDDAIKSQTALAEKMSAVALDAVGKSTELSAKWTQDTLTKLQGVSTAKPEPADYAKAVTDFTTDSAEVAAEHMSAFAEIAKKLQSQTVELMMAAGKDMSQDVTKAAKKAAAK